MNQFDKKIRQKAAEEKIKAPESVSHPQAALQSKNHAAGIFE